MFYRIFSLLLVFIISISYAQNENYLNLKAGGYKQGNKNETTQLQNPEEKFYKENFLLPKKESNFSEEEKEFLKEKKEKIKSNIEKIYIDRLDKSKPVKIKQFGYEFFKNYRVYEMGSLGDTYTLGPGDTILLYIWGDPIDILKLDGFYKLSVDREGKVYIPNLGVFYVWGLTVKQVKELFYGYFSKKFKNFKLEVSLGKLRYYPVYVSGFVKRPGVVLINATHTVIDALALAGGISKNGSLRNIIIHRATGKDEKIDLYDLLIYGKPINIKLKENDAVFVGAIGKTSAIYGSVKRAAIYELKEKEALKDLINYSGGLLPSTYEYGLKIYRYENNNLHLINGKYKDNNFLSLNLKDGDLVEVVPVYNFKENIIKVKGHVKYPGEYSFEKYRKLSELLPKIGLLPDTNMYYGEITRIEEEGKPPVYMTFMPEDVINGKYDINLKPLDTIKFYKFGDIKSVDFNKFKNSIVIKGHIKYPGVYAYKNNMKLSDILNKKQLLIDTNMYYGDIYRKEITDKGIQYKIINFKPLDVLNKKKDIFLEPMDSITFYPKEIYAPIKIAGEVKESKLISYYRGITLLDALRNINFNISPKYLKAIIIREISNKDIKKVQKEETAKGIKESVEGKEKILKQSTEVYLLDLLVRGDKSKNVTLLPGDKILIKRNNIWEKDKTVTILGEVNRPGIYRYESGMRLYDLIVKAGGYTEDAYPKALIFIRESAKKLQQEQLQSSILAMEEELAQSSEGIQAVGASPAEQALAKMVIEKQKRLLEIIKQKAKIGLGRIALNIPNTLEKLKKSPDNIELQDGDFIYVPAKPNYVLVLGSVYNQISLPYRKNKTVEYYLKQVGGLKDNAKEDDIYIIKANGRVISKRNFDSGFIGWEDDKIVFGKDFYSMKLEQGDTIVVPSEIKVPIMWRPLIKDVTQIIFQALSTAVLAKRL